METLRFYSECSEKFNTKVLRELVAITKAYEKALPLGWRAIIELQRSGDSGVYYALDICSRKDAGAAAPAKMATLKRFPKHAHTGYQLVEDFLSDLRDIDFDKKHPQVFNDILGTPAMRTMSAALHKEFTRASGLSAWYGGIRLPYDILVTEKLGYQEKADLSADPAKMLVASEVDTADGEARISDSRIRRTTGEIRIAFSGAQEWQDTFFAFLLMRHVQRVMAKCWKRDQISFNTAKLQDGDAHVAFYCCALPLLQCPTK